MRWQNTDNIWVRWLVMLMVSSLISMFSWNFYAEVQAEHSKYKDEHQADLAREARQHRDEDSDNETFEVFGEIYVMARPKES